MLHICRDLLRAEPAPQAQKKLLRSLQELRYPSGTGATVCSAGCSLSTVSAVLWLSTAWPLARVLSLKCHQKTLSVNRCGWVGNVQQASTISTQSWHKQTTHRILFTA